MTSKTMSSSQSDPKKFPVVEIFGPTIQGEGEFQGVKTLFVRFAGCDFHCKWCDTKYAWKEDAGWSMMTTDEIVKNLMVMPYTKVVTLTGGNPALYNLRDLIWKLQSRGFQVHAETQGSIAVDWLGLVDALTLSPKPPSSGMAFDESVFTKVLDSVDTSNPDRHAGFWHSFNKDIRVSIKVVVITDGDFAFAKYIHRRYPHIPMYFQVGNLLPDAESVSSSGLLDRLNALIDRVMRDDLLWDIRVLPQLHVLLWGNRRCV